MYPALTRKSIRSLIVKTLLTLLLFLAVSMTSFSQSWPSGVHDPSSIVKNKDRYWIFGTGDGIYSKYSYDLVTWQDGPTPFPTGEFPQWILNYAKSNTDQFGGFFWAPDIIYMNNQYYLYYSASVWGTTYSCIGLVVNKTLDPNDPNYKWVDQGDIGIFSPRWGWQINAIDAALMRGPDGRIWLTYGSFNRDGILVTEVDSVSGKPIGETISVANSWTGGSAYGEGEGGHMFYHEGYYYMVYNKGGCCNGIASSYYMVIGRSESPQGPFIDKDGKAMRVVGAPSGGTVVFKHDDDRELEDRYYGPGHFGLFRENGNEYVSFHYYDPNGYYPSEAADFKGGPTQGLAKLKWGEDGWPEISMDFLKEGIYTMTNANSNKALDLQNHSTASGTIPYQYSADPDQETQKWYFKPLGTGEYTIQSYADTSKYLETLGTNTVQLTGNYTGAINQKWRLVRGTDGRVLIYPSTKDNILEIPNAYTQDYRVHLWANTNHPCQRWIPNYISEFPRFSVTGNELYYEHDGTTSDSIMVSSNLNWEISIADSSWVSIMPGKGHGDATISVIVEENESGTARETVMSIKPETGTAKIVLIKQEAAPENPVINGISKEMFKVAPNPTNGLLKLTSPIPVSVTIYNLSGKQMMHFEDLGTIKELNLSNLPDGMYYLNITSEKGNWVKKVIKH